MEPKKDIFAELAKIKTEPAPLIKISGETKKAEDGEGTLTVDVYQNGDYIVVQSTIAGVKDETGSKYYEWIRHHPRQTRKKRGDKREGLFLPGAFLGHVFALHYSPRRSESE
jgi:hypothetical protein